MVALILFLVLVDQESKALVRNNLQPGTSRQLVGPLLKITYKHDTSGFAWFIPALPGWAGTVFLSLRLLLVLAAWPVYAWYRRRRPLSRWADAALIGLTAGLLGNLGEDLFLSATATTDFLQVFNSPCANLADVYSYLGLAALVIEAFRLKRRPRP